MSFGEIKGFLKREYPSITYGAQTATVNGISISGNTSGTLANILLVEGVGNKLKAQTGASVEPMPFEDVILFPASITVSLMGMPMIARGENIFIDFNTDTSLDNLYTVKSVDHSLESGRFTTELVLVASNQGAIKSFRNNLIKKTSQIIELEEPE